MSEIKWDDNAKSAVDYFADWLRADYSYIANLEDFYKRLPQQKTVADAYEAFNGKWPSSRYNFAWWDSDFEQFLIGCNETSDTVCTREQFEAYAKEQEAKQEGEKWTHTYRDEKCVIKFDEPDFGGFILADTERYGYQLYKLEDLKPIKPKLTKAEAWDYAVDSRMHTEEIMEIYDII